MKKIIVLLLSLVIVTSAFAVTLPPAQTADFTLSIAESIEIGFLKNGNTEMATIDTEKAITGSSFALTTTGSAFGGDYRLAGTDIFYIYYRALTAETNLYIKLEATTPIKFSDGSTAADEVINYTATLAKTATWNGADPNGAIDSSTTKSKQVAIKAGASATATNVSGLCKVTISSTDDLATKKPGNTYKGTMTLSIITV